jgi:hypothetical protein
MTGSLQERLKARRNAWKTEDARLPVPGYGGEVVARYGETGWGDVRKFSMNAAMTAMGAEIPASKEVEEAASMLLAANLGLDAEVDDQTAEIKDESGQPVKLGLSLARFLGLDLDGIDTDRQALFLIFPNERALMNHAMALVGLQEEREAEADEAIAKNSGAVS